MNLSIIDTQKAIKQIKYEFEKDLSESLNLLRVSAPKFVKTNTGIQDDLANTCTPVKFNVPACGYDVEIVHSLAKWKRIALQKYNIPVHEGIYTDMDAIRKDEILDFMHSAYVDQWDWEQHINPEDRTDSFLIQTVGKIYNAMRLTESKIHNSIRCMQRLRNEPYPEISHLPDFITYVRSEELEEMYPNMTPKERENEITKKHGAVFLMGIGYPLKNGKPHDIRAFDYDDWSTPVETYMTYESMLRATHDINFDMTIMPKKQFHGLNGDILVWNEVTQCAFELSSMGIRVDTEALVNQAEIMSSNTPITSPYHMMVATKKIPLSIGGGIGQSRLCMYILKKHHIGEVQVSEWPDSMIDECKKSGIHLL